jgi:hypothetical protein
MDVPRCCEWRYIVNIDEVCVHKMFDPCADQAG